MDIGQWTELPVAALLTLSVLTALTPKGRRGIRRLLRALDILETELSENAGSSVKDAVEEARQTSQANNEALGRIEGSLQATEASARSAHQRIDHIHSRLDRLTD